MFDLIVSAATLVLWFVYLFPPFACSKSPGVQSARCVVAAVLGGCIGLGFGRALSEVLIR